MFAASRNYNAPGHYHTSNDFANNKASEPALSMKFFESVVDNINKKRFLLENARSNSSTKIENMLLASKQFVK